MKEPYYQGAGGFDKVLKEMRGCGDDFSNGRVNGRPFFWPDSFDPHNVKDCDGFMVKIIANNS